MAGPGGGRVLLREPVKVTADSCFASLGNSECCFNNTQDTFASILGRTEFPRAGASQMGA